jgi:hypothetical protein
MTSEYDDTVYWAAVLDGDIEGADKRTTRRAAEADARWLRNHPARQDRLLFGNGGRVEVMRVQEDYWVPGDWVEVR